ncbi:glycosidase [Flavobacteriaceae bacterium TP-CH-4]|uniref:Glycosidase n=1 Tax=Pelagihabitans pacificus TaxID=2696054 RepID=A0A967AQQ5_9FLAO|nr:glycoside hydrolase family 130 protein [Pelagihabitans pacificus]NHF58583.1 glycosidase [Pelagihabitans pacificus]
MKVTRSVKNPIIAPKDVKPSREDFEVVCVFNCGVIRFQGKVLLMLRVAERPKARHGNEVRTVFYDHIQEKITVKSFEKDMPGIGLHDSRYIYTPERIYLSSMSHFRLATSTNGIDFDIDEQPCMEAANVYEMYGIEDPRITKIGDDYWVNYSACSTIGGVTTCLAVTRDFKNFERKGVMFTPDNKDVAIFPEKIHGKYYALNRPISAEYKLKDIWISESPDIEAWGNHRFLISTREGYWDDGRIGCSAVPFRTEAGWLEIYHGASKDNVYCLGAVLLDLEEPWKVISRSENPIMLPEEDYEINGFFGNVIFNCGVLVEEGIVKIYYGAADTYIGYAEVALQDILDDLK